jgi:hypothetical protein
MSLRVDLAVAIVSMVNISKSIGNVAKKQQKTTNGIDHLSFYSQQ